MEPQTDNSGIEKMKRGLYSRDIRTGTGGRIHRLKSESYDTANDWSHEGEKIQDKKPLFLKEKKGMTFVMKFFVISILFFLIASGVAFYRFYYGSNTISANNIEVSVVGPVSVSGGQKISLDIKVDNNNKTDLKTVDLRVEYPDGSRSIDDLKTELKRTRDSIGDIPQGESAEKIVEAILFGEEKTKKEIKITVEYRISGSSAIFYKEKIYEVVISDSPVSIEVVGLKEVNANQATDFSITVVSNSSNPIRNLLLKAEYPFGFVFSEASKSALDSNNSLWSIGDISPGEKKTIKIYGKLQGQDGEDKVIRFTTGIASDRDEKIIATPLVTSLVEVSIKKPFIGVQVALDGNFSNELVSKSGKVIRGDVLWKNNLTTPVKDVEIQIKLKGDALNKSSVYTDLGFYKSIDSTVIFNKTNNKNLASIAPGESGSLSSYSGLSMFEPSIYLDIVANGKRLEGDNVPQEVLYSGTKMIKIATDTRLSSKALHWSGPFENSGYMPPKAENETTYTIIWTITNTSNKIKNAKVTATLPIYVKWLSQTNPESENISFNSVGSEVVWDIGDIEAGAGIDSPPKEVSFQISFLPSLSQEGQSPVILNESTLSGKDAFTSTSVGDARSSLTTTLKFDPDFKYGEDKVVK